MLRNATQHVCLAVVLCASAVCHPAAAQQLVVVIDKAQVPAPVLAEAEKEVVRVFSRAGIQLRLRDCPAGPGTGACFGGPSDEPLFVQLLSKRPLGAVSREALGYSAATPQGGNNAWIFLPQIHDVVANAGPGASLARILGHAMAHELCHLLSVADHRLKGLMRVKWDAGDYRLMAMGELLISAPDAARMREHLKAKAARTPPATAF